MKLEITVTHRFEFVPGQFPWATQAQLNALETRMGVLDDKLTEVEKSVDDAIGRVATDVQALRDEIAALQQKVEEGTATPAQIERLNSIKAKADALDPTVAATIPPEQVPQSGGQ